MEKVIVVVLGVSGLIILTAALTGGISEGVVALALALFFGILVGFINAVVLALMWRDGWAEGRRTAACSSVNEEKSEVIILVPEFQKKWKGTENSIVRLARGNIQEVV